jgi:hypothetical protein
VDEPVDPGLRSNWQVLVNIAWILLACRQRPAQDLVGAVGRCGAVGALDRGRFTFIYGATRRTLSLHPDQPARHDRPSIQGWFPCETRWRARRLPVRAEPLRVQRLDAGPYLGEWRAVPLAQVELWRSRRRLLGKVT